MDKNFFKRLFGLYDDTEEAIEFPADLPAEEKQPTRTFQRLSLAMLQIIFYTTNKATVEIVEYRESPTVQYQQRLVLDYYAETLYRLGNSEASHQLHQYIGALCVHLLEGGTLKRINILGTLLELLVHAPTDVEAMQSQKAILYQNEDSSLETEFCDPVLPAEYYLPTSMLLIFQHILYTLPDESIAQLLMAISAVHTFYATRYSFTEPEGRRLAVRHALQQLEQNA